MSKIVIIGAGSGFGGRLSLDIMSREALQDSTICLCDIHPERLRRVAKYVQAAIDKHNMPTKVVASTNRKELLPDADFVVTSVAVGGAAYAGHPYATEKEIPLKYGIDQTVADTIGVGGVFRFLRTGPVHHQFIKDMEQLCPDAQVLNHTNPMSMLTWLHLADSSMQFVGLCHSVQGTTQKLARLIDVPYEEVSYEVAGINHQSWVLEFKRGKEDLYPRLRELLDDPEKTKGDEVRFEMMRQFGCFPTESSRHNSEYLPYFRRTAELREYYFPPRPSDAPPRQRPANRQRSWRDWMRDPEATDDEMPEPTIRLSNEFTTGIMEGIATNKPFLFNGNVLNHGLVTNLPQGCCVEVPCVADGRGVTPCYVGDLPPQLAALNRSNIAVHELAVRAVLDRDKEAAFHACALDPLAASVVSLPKMREMFEELWEAEGDLLLHFDPDHKGPMPETCAK